MEMPFWGLTWVSPRNSELDGVEIPLERGKQFWGLSGPLKSIWILYCSVCSKTDHSVINNGMTADFNVSNWLVSHYIVPLEKI